MFHIAGHVLLSEMMRWFGETYTPMRTIHLNRSAYFHNKHVLPFTFVSRARLENKEKYFTVERKAFWRELCKQEIGFGGV